MLGVCVILRNEGSVAERSTMLDVEAKLDPDEHRGWMLVSGYLMLIRSVDTDDIGIGCSINE